MVAKRPRLLAVGSGRRSHRRAARSRRAAAGQRGSRGHRPLRRDGGPGYAAPVALDLSRSAADLTAQLVDIESVSGAEKPLADAIEAALGALRGT